MSSNTKAKGPRRLIFLLGSARYVYSNQFRLLLIPPIVTWSPSMKMAKPPPPQTLPRKYLTTTGCLQTSMVCLRLRVHVNPQKNTVGVMLPGTAGNRAKEGVGVVLRPLTINAIHVLDPSYAVSTRNPSSSHSEGHPTPAWSKTPDQKHQWAACCCSCKRLVCTCCSYTCYYK